MAGMNFDMNTIWSRAIELVRENLSLLAIVAAVFLLLPSVAVYLFMPQMTALTDPAADPEVMAAQFQANIGPLLMVGGLSTIVQFIGYGAMIALMGGQRPTVGEALATGFKITPSTLAVFVIFMVLYTISATIIVIPFAIIGSLAGAPGIAGLGVLPILAVVIYLAARMSMSMPVLVLEDSLNPISAVIRSFKLTKARQWSILIFWLVLFLCYFVMALLLSSAIGVIAAMAGGGTATALILGITNGLMGMAVGMIICGIAVAMYGQLNGPSDNEITSVFD